MTAACRWGAGPRALAAVFAAAVLALQFAPHPAAAQDTSSADTQAEDEDESRTLLRRAREDDEADASPTTSSTTNVLDPGVEVLEAGKNGAYRLELRAPAAQRAVLARHLDLARFRDQSDISPVEIGRLIATAPAQVRSLLEPLGHFNAQAELTRVEDPAGGPPTLRVQVDPGPVARVGRVQIELQGAYAEAIDTGNESLSRRWGRQQARWALPVGAAFNQSAWTGAKNALLASLRTRGYPAASYIGSGAEVDPDTQRVRLFLVVDSGPEYRLGEVRIEGLEHTPPEAALNLRPFGEGEIYTEKALLDYQESLQKAGLYEGVAVELDLDPEQAAQAAVIVRLREHLLQSASVGIGFSTNTGPRISLEHTHRKLFGYDLVGTSRVKLGRDERELSFDLLTYPKERGYRNLLAVQADYLDAGGARTQSQRVRVGRLRDTEAIDRLYYLEFNRTTLETATGRSNDRALLGNYEWVWRDVNSVVFPTRGLIIAAQGGAGYAVDGDGDKGPFGRVLITTIAYERLSPEWYLQLRGQAGQVFKRDALGVPDTLLFRAGGDDSVRGYGYRTLGPTRDGSVVGGPVIATGTVELMRRFSDRWRDWYGAVFVDAGNAATRWDDFDPVLGYGVGVRWRSPIGPLRLDLAYGQDASELRLHVSVGVSF